jgi:hypothetical protein
MSGVFSFLEKSQPTAAPWPSLKHERICLYSYGTVGKLNAHVAESKFLGLSCI